MSNTVIGFTIQAQGSTKTLATIKELKEEIKRLNKERENVKRGSAAFNELTSSVAKAKEELKRTNDELRQQQRAFAAARTGAGSYRQLNEELVQARRAIKELSLEELKSASGQKLLSRIQELDAELKKFDASVGQFNRNVGNYPQGSYLRLKTELNDAREAVKRLSLEELKSARGQALLKKIKELDDKVKDFDRTTSSFGDGLNAYPRGIGSIGTALGSLSGVAASVGVSMNLALGPVGLVAAGVAGLVAVGGKAVGIYKDFQQEVATLAAISGESAGNIDFLEEQAKELGETTQFTASQVVQLQTNFARVGFKADQIEAATESTLNLAAATGEDLATSAEVAAATLGGYGLEAAETKRVNDVMAQSFNSSALNLERFSESTKLVAPAAKAAGVDIETTTAALGALADQGLSGSIAGTALRRIMAELGTENSKLSNRIGFTVKNSDDFRRALQVLSAQGVSNADAIALVGRNASSVFGALVNGSDKVQALSQTFYDADEAIDGFDGAAAKAAATVNDTLQGDLLKLQSALEGAAIRFAELGGDGLRTIVQFATNSVPVVTDQLLSVVRVFRPVLEAIERVGERVGALGDRLLKLGGQAGATERPVLSLGSVVQLMAVGMELLANIVEGVVDAFIFLVDEVPAVRKAIGALQAGFSILAKGVDQLPLVMGGVREVVRQFFNNIQNYFKQLGIAVDIFQKRASLLNPFADKSAIKKEIEDLKKEQETLKDAGFNAGKAYQDGFDKALKARAVKPKEVKIEGSNATNPAGSGDATVGDPGIPTPTDGKATDKAKKAAEKAAKEAERAKRDALQLAFEEEKLLLQTQFAERQTTKKEYDASLVALEKQRIQKELETLELSELERVQRKQKLAEIDIRQAEEAVKATEDAKRAAIDAAFEAESEQVKTQEAQRLLSKQEADVKLLELEQVRLNAQLEQLDLNADERLRIEREVANNELKINDARFEADAARIERANDERRAALLLQLRDEQITQQEYNQAGVELERQALMQKIALYEQYGIDTLDLVTRLAEMEVQIAKDKGAKITADEQAQQKARLDAAQKVADVSRGLISAVADFNAASKERELADAGSNTAKKEAIERKYAKKQQDTAVLQALIQGALGIVKTGGNLGYPQAIPFQIAQGLQTLAQVAVIRSKKFARGGFTGGGIDYRDDTGQRVAGVVHEREWVASRGLVEHPTYGRLIRRLEDVQRGRAMRLQPFAVGGFTSPRLQPSFGDFQRNDATQQLLAQNALLQAAIESTNARIDRIQVIANSSDVVAAAAKKDFVAAKFKL